MEESVRLEPQKETQKTLMFSINQADYHGPFKFHIEARPENGGDVIRKDIEFLGPDPAAISGMKH
jgi:hypothetical protein